MVSPYAHTISNINTYGVSPTAVHIEPAIRKPKPKVKVLKARWHKGKLKYI